MKSDLRSVLALSSAVLAASSLGCSTPTYAQRPTPSVPAEGPGAPGARSVVIVRVPVPWYAPRFLVRSKFRDALGEYEPLAPLEAKYFTLTDDARYGGIYLWTSRDAAEHHFDAAWRKGVRERRGVDADVLVLDAPYVVQGPALPDGKPMGTRSLEYPAFASFVQLELPADGDRDAPARALAQLAWPNEALIRGVVVKGPRFVGVVALWATRRAAEAAVGAEAVARLQQASGGGSASHVLFEAPLLMDASLRERDR